MVCRDIRPELAGEFPSCVCPPSICCQISSQAFVTQRSHKQHFSGRQTRSSPSMGLPELQDQGTVPSAPCIGRFSLLRRDEGSVCIIKTYKTGGWRQRREGEVGSAGSASPLGRKAGPGRRRESEARVPWHDGPCQALVTLARAAQRAGGLVRNFLSLGGCGPLGLTLGPARQCSSVFGAA